MSNVVKYFNYAQQGAPSVANNWGDLTNLLDACLVTGFNIKSIASITRIGSEAVVTITLGHGYQADQVLLISGCDQAEYNGEHRVKSITSTTFIFDVVGTPVTPATGSSISVRTAPLGFEIAFIGTNKRVYRSTNTASSRPYLRVDNSDPASADWPSTYAKSARVTMAEKMLSVDTFGTGSRAPYDNTNRNEQLNGSGVTVINGWYRWWQQRNYINGDATADSAAATPKQWAIIGDDRGFYFHIQPCAQSLASATGFSGYCFTDFIPLNSKDVYTTLMCASDLSYAANYYNASMIGNLYPDIGNFFSTQLDYSGKVLLKDYSQTGTYVRAGFCSINSTLTQLVSGFSSHVPFPNGGNIGIEMYPVYLREELNVIVRGKMPGLYHIPQAAYTAYPAFSVITRTDLANKKFVLLAGCANNGVNQTRVAYDLTGPWR